MSSKRRLRRKVCEGKKRYLSIADARIGIVSLYRSGNDRGGAFNAYYCSFCGGVHIGHRPGSGLRRA